MGTSISKLFCMSLYPLKFRPRLVEKMWGGRKLQTVLGKSIPEGKQIGESWELFDFPPGAVESSQDWVSSELANGPLAGRTLHWLVQHHRDELLGPVPLSGREGQFPILIKFLDAREDLSLQVHPDRAYADANPHAHLKSEAWYVLQRDPGSRVLNGLKPGVTRQQFQAAIDRGDVNRLIKSIDAQEGDCFYLPSGTVHALGHGLLVAEVQTPSDTTFRVFDFNRVDPTTGKPRTLHVEQALQCIDFSSEGTEPLSAGPDPRLVSSPYFHLDRTCVNAGGTQRLDRAGPSVLIVVDGSLELDGPISAGRGEVVLVPASLRAPAVRTDSGCVFLEVTFPV
jgi:mannose-6-phosphate isomerase